jgi:hypothetical protein
LRALRVAPACQLALNLGEASSAGWHGLPDAAQATVLTLLAQMIARSVIAEDGTVETTGGCAGAGRG